MKSFETLIYFTNHQKILKFLLAHPDQKFYDRQISHLAGVSRAGTNFALRDLAKAGLLGSEKHGRMSYYHISLHSPLVREMKVFLNMVTLSDLVETLRPLCRKVVLFGSAAKGTNTAESDYDLLIITNEKQKVSSIIMKSKMREELQTVVVTQSEYIGIKIKNPVFYRELLEGKALWEKE